MTMSEGVAIVTGAAGGIGAATAMKLANRGASLALVDVVSTGIEALARKIEETGGTARYYCTNVGDEADVRSCVKNIVDDFGRVDFLVNNAGIAPKGANGKKAILTDVSYAEWETVIKVNLSSVFLVCKECIPHIIKGGVGGIVNIASSVVFDGGFLSAVHYSASKGGVAAMTRTLARELAPYAIRVNAVAPGRVETPMSKLSSDERKQAALARVPLGRVAAPEEIANSVAYLLSDEASYITGVTLNVSGGYVIV